VELSWSTFILEIINFLVLVWILKRLLYQPVLEAIAARQASIEKTLADAHVLQTEAATLQAQYAGRLIGWEKEREAARTALQGEIDVERERQLELLRKTLEQELEKARVLEQRRLDDALRQNEETALAHGARFTARLLAAIASPEIEARLIELAVARLPELPAERLAVLRSAFESEGNNARVVSAYAMSARQRQALEEVLSGILGKPLQTRYEQSNELLAGLRIIVGPWVLRANLRDELQSFTESKRASA
jgi:F-type H+-transporting ATPase subunit b